MKPVLLTPLALLPLILGACSSEDADGAATTERRAAQVDTETETDTETGATEETGPRPRLAISHDGGVLVLDAATGDLLLEEPLDGFVRLSPAGDDRHVMVSRGGGFTALDLGAWTEEHGDHGHSWTVPPTLSDFEVAAEEPGHVVGHGGHTTLFDDGTGQVTTFATADLAELPSEPEVTTWTLDEAHHGVAVVDEHGNLAHTVGGEDGAVGVRVETNGGAELAASPTEGPGACPGVHGEAHVGEVAAFGCQDGVLLLDGRELTKVESPDPYGRIGNQAGHETSPVLLGDYKSDPDAELERPTRVALVDSRDATLRLVDLGTSYTFRSLGRSADGDGVVLGTDGALHVIDVGRGRVTDRFPVVAPWREPTDWQQPRPTLEVVGDVAYVSDPAERAVHVVDLATGTVTDRIDVGVVPQELQAVSG
ncbi:hypothetical protein [Nocardioides sp. 1609]|uniref:hypothetical protein n=1 Tax=Nocardioides sp. 1609 TaxID=2508327 RepID=UPI001ADB9E4E|nr:hypothetical protein [Nocardioides sp. 1609]